MHPNNFFQDQASKNIQNDQLTLNELFTNLSCYGTDSGLRLDVTLQKQTTWD